MAIWRKNPDAAVYKFLVENKVDVKDSEGRTMLLMAAMEGNGS